MKPQFSRMDSHLAYLEPPHSHDPTSVSTIASLPSSTLKTLPPTVQSALYNLQQSTSIVYASFIRLQELLEERFERLNPTTGIDGEVTFSEHSFLTYVNSLSAERDYLLSGAHPDWRHKAFLARVTIQPYYDVLIESISTDSNSPSNILLWWECLQSAVASWCDYARTVHIPDYEDTIGEYQTFHKAAPALAIDLDDTPLETPLDTPTPILEQEPASLQFGDIRDSDFSSPTLHVKEAEADVTGLGLTGALEVGSMTGTVVQEHATMDEGKVRDERKDSGVGMNQQM